MKFLSNLIFIVKITQQILFNQRDNEFILAQTTYVKATYVNQTIKNVGLT